MFICYMDESGTSELPGTSSHFVLAGFAIPIDKWRACDQAISQALSSFGLENEELHTAWILRGYPEQAKIRNFESLDWASRRSAVERQRATELLRLRQKNNKQHNQTKKNYEKTKAYIHLSRDERRQAVKAVCEAIGEWDYARLFAECIDKIHHDPVLAKREVAEQAFEQVVSRYQYFLTNASGGNNALGLLIHDNNQSVSTKHTHLMRQFHSAGTLWTSVSNIIETPLFVDSHLTRMVQIADLCAYALRRYVENQEVDLFRRIFRRADTLNGRAVGVRHYAGLSCRCEICEAHRPKTGVRPSRGMTAPAAPFQGRTDSSAN